MYGEKIKKLRTDKGMTQKKLAEKSHMSISYIQQLERGEKNNPSLDVLLKFAVALNVPVDDLLYNSNFSYDLLEAVCSDFMGLSGMTDNMFIAIEDNLCIPFDTLKAVKNGIVEFSRDEKETLLSFLEGKYSPKYVELKRRFDNAMQEETHMERWFYYLLEDRFGDCLPDSYGVSFPTLDKNEKTWDKLTYEDIERLKNDIYSYIDFYVYKSKLEKNKDSKDNKSL